MDGGTDKASRPASRRAWPVGIRKALVPALAAVSMLGGAGPAWAAAHDPTALQIEAIGTILLKFLVLAVVFEAALSTVFNWRWFIKRFEGKGVKTVIAVGLAWLIFGTAGINIFKDLMTTLEPGKDLFAGPLTSSAASFVTALLIAGGSDAIFRIYATLKMRDPAERIKKAQAERGDGTIQVKVERAGKVDGALKLSVDNGAAVDMAADHHMLFNQRTGPHQVVVTGSDPAGKTLTVSAQVLVPESGNAAAALAF